MKKAFILGMLFLLMVTGRAFSYSEDHDEYTLELKGFSPELVDMVQATLSRNEGRYPETPPTRLQKVWYNLVNGEVVEPLQPTGYTQVSPGLLPKRPK